MPVDDLKPGMKGVGKTVFKGTKVEDFEVEIVGVLKNARPRSDLILLKLVGGPLEESGVISGMSGSPVYVEGKLVGALAYALGTFPKEAVAAAIPIKQMLSLELQSGIGMKYPGDGTLKDIIPISVPLVFSGFDQRSIEWASEQLTGFGLAPMAGGGGGDADDAPLVPGSVLSVKFVEGDLDMSAVGTLTHVDGDRFYGFGHPLLHMGKVELPAAGGYVHTVYKSSMSSNKIVSATRSMGAIVEDRASGVSGVLGAEADMMPLAVTVRHGKSTTEYNMKVMLHELFTPLLVASAVMSCANNSGARAGETMVEAEINLAVKGHEPVNAQTAYTDSFAIRSLAIDIMGLFAYLMGNGFEKISFDEVRVSMTLTDERRAAYIRDGFISKKEFEPGETVSVSLKIKPSLGEEYIESVDIVIPEDVRNEEVRITIADGGSESANRISSNSYMWNPQSMDEMLLGIDMVKAPSNLVVKMYRKGRGVSVSGGEMPAVPPSFLSVVGESQPHRVKRDADSPFYERVIESDKILIGSLTFVVQVKER
jgi:hypothetical protein